VYYLNILYLPIAQIIFSVLSAHVIFMICALCLVYYVHIYMYYLRILYRQSSRATVTCSQRVHNNTTLAKQAIALPMYTCMYLPISDSMQNLLMRS
jgi:heme/copper-type cytochrome/quinol oxidase subunit 2